MAFSSRTHGEYQTLTAPARTPFMVMTALTAERASSGSFSTTSQESFLGGIAVWTAVPESDSCAEANIRRNGQVPDDSRFTGVPAICAQGEQKKQHAQRVLAFGDPSHRFDVDGMQGKQRGHHQAASGVTCRTQQYPEQQENVEHMQQQVDVVMSGRIQLKELAIQGVRKPGERMPGVHVERGECPRDCVPVDSALDLEIVRHVEAVIVVDEWVAVDGAVKRNGCHHKKKPEKKWLGKPA